MTFKTVCEYFPLNETYVGNYGEDQVITIVLDNALQFSPADPNPILEWNEDGAFPFVVYEPSTNTLHCIYYAYFTVQGYINKTDDPDNFYPATNSPSFGWEIVDPEFGEATIFTPDDELAAELGYEGQEHSRVFRREQAAYYYDIEAYMNERIFTTYKALNKFLRERNNS